MYDKFNKKYNGMMNAAVIEKYYDYSHFYNVGFWEESTMNQKEASENLVRRLLNAHKGEKEHVLDVACGKGAACKYISDEMLYKKISGININDSQIAFCKTLVPQADFRVMDACDMQFESNQFDTIISIDAVNHFPSRQIFISKAFEILKPGGTLSISDVLFYAPLQNGLNWMNPDKNITVDEYESLIKNAGFNNIEIIDVMNSTWIPYLKYMKQWIEKEFIGNTLSKNEIKGMMNIYKSTKEMPIKHHVLINAKK